MKKIRVLIVDDSAFMRKKIAEILSSDPRIEVISTVKNGKEAVDAVLEFKPDVVTLDIEMPVMNGLDALREIIEKRPTPCVMISAFTKQGARETIIALESGAVDFVMKPGGVISIELDSISSEIIEKVRNAAFVPTERLKPSRLPEKKKQEEVLHKPKGLKKVFTVASSTGGTQALAVILPKLAADTAASILVVQHMPPAFTRSLADRLNIQSDITVVEAEEGMRIKPAQVVIAKGGFHMEVAGTIEAPFITLSEEPPIHGLRPCADVLMTTAADLFGDMVVGIVLTGMGSDGKEGAAAIKNKGGIVIAEHESTCTIYGMPKMVVEAGLADKVLPVDKIADEMKEILNA